MADTEVMPVEAPDDLVQNLIAAPRAALKSCRSKASACSPLTQLPPLGSWAASVSTHHSRKPLASRAGPQLKAADRSADAGFPAGLK